MRKLAVLIILLLSMACRVSAQDFVQAFNFASAGIGGPGIGKNFTSPPTGVNFFFMSWSPGGPLNSCSVRLDSSTDGITWGSGDVIASQSCSSVGSASGSFTKTFVRVNVTAMNGVGGLNVTLQGYVSSSGGGGFPVITPVTVGTGGSITTTGTGTITATNGVSSVASLPATCTPGTTSPIQLSTPPFGIFYCITANTWSPSSADSGVIDPTSFGAKFDGRACFGNSNTITTNGTTVTCNVAAFCNGSSVACAIGQSSDVGKQFTATSGCCGVTANFQGVSLLVSPSTPTTITAVTSPTTITISQSAGVNSGAGLVIAWATNDDAAITAAETAWQSGNKCRTFQIPAGITAVLQPHWTNPGANCLAMGIQDDYMAQVQGQGIGATIIGIFPGFNFAGCPTTGCFGGYTEQTWANFQFDGFGWGNTGVGSAKNLVGAGFGSQISQVACSATGGSDINLTGLSSGIGIRVWGISWDGCGNTGWNVAGGITKAYYCFLGDNLGPAVSIAVGDLTDFGCDYGAQGGVQVIVLAGSGARYHGVGSNLFNCSNTSSATAISMGNTLNAVVILDGARFNCTSANSNGVYMNAPTQKLYLVGATHIGGTSAAVLQSAGTMWIDRTVTLDAGLITGTAVRSIIADGHSLTGICTGVVTSLQTLGLYGTGSNETLTTCTSSIIGNGIPVSGAATSLGLTVSATIGGVNASSGLVTVLKNSVATVIVCTIGTGTSCVDTTHSVAFVNGDLISLQFTTQAADTLAGVRAEVIWQ